MKTKVLKIALALIVVASSLYAQETKKVHLKLVKEVNGERTVVDTIIEGDDTHDYLFYALDKDGDIKLDSIIEDFDIDEKDGMRVISIKAKDNDSDPNKYMWISATGEGEAEDHIVVHLDADAKWVDDNGDITILGDDSVKIVKEIIVSSNDENMMFIGDDAKKIKIKVDSDDVYTWSVDSSNVKVIKIEKEVVMEGGEEGTFHIYMSGDDEGEVKTMSKVFVKEGKGESKTIELIVDTDDENQNVKVIDLQEKLENSDEDIVITKYKTEDGKMVIKAEITTDKEKLKLNNLEINYDSKKGELNLEFESDLKDDVVVKVLDGNGKEIFTDKVKKFKGKYSNKIDLKDKKDSVYILEIMQGEKSLTKKI